MTLMLTAMGISSFLNGIPAGLYALVGTLFGGIGLRVLEKWLNKSKDKQEVRRDLNQEIKDLQERLDKVEDEVSEWRKRAYDAEEQVALLRIMVIKLGGELPQETVAKIQNDAKEAQQ